jgi:hypothetical protein
MRIELNIQIVDPEGVSTDYSYCVELPDKTSLDQVEAHSANMLRILNKQAETTADDDDDDGDKWKKPDEPKTKQP